MALSLQPVIDLINSINFTSFFDRISDVFSWLLSTVTSLFTSLASVVTYANTAISNLVSFMNANSGFGTLFSSMWLIVPSYIVWGLTLVLTFGVVFVMIRRL